MSDIDLVRMLCPRLTCQQVLTVSEKLRGQLVWCRRCRSVVRVPKHRPVVAASEGNEPAAAAS